MLNVTKIQQKAVALTRNKGSLGFLYCENKLSIKTIGTHLSCAQVIDLLAELPDDNTVLELELNIDSTGMSNFAAFISSVLEKNKVLRVINIEVEPTYLRGNNEQEKNAKYHTLKKQYKHIGHQFAEALKHNHSIRSFRFYVPISGWEGHSLYGKYDEDFSPIKNNAELQACLNRNAQGASLRSNAETPASLESNTPSTGYCLFSFFQFFMPKEPPQEPASRDVPHRGLGSNNGGV